MREGAQKETATCQGFMRPRDGVFVIFETRRFSADERGWTGGGGTTVCVGQRERGFERSRRRPLGARVPESPDASEESARMEMQSSIGDDSPGRKEIVCERRGARTPVSGVFPSANGRLCVAECGSEGRGEKAKPPRHLSACLLDNLPLTLEPAAGLRPPRLKRTEAFLVLDRFPRCPDGEM